MTQDNQLVPILREGIDIIKIITYKMLKECFNQKFEDLPAKDSNKLSGIVVNIVFGTLSDDESIKAKQLQYKDEIQQVIDILPGIFGDFCDIITDTLRIQILCDGHHNIDSTPILKQAEKLRVLNIDRPLPLPNDFIAMVRDLGAKHQLIAPM